jgi:hypothetical protein
MFLVLQKITKTWLVNLFENKSTQIFYYFFINYFSILINHVLY